MAKITQEVKDRADDEIETPVPNGMATFTVRGTTIKDSTGNYCGVDDIAYLTPEHAKVYSLQDMLRLVVDEDEADAIAESAADVQRLSNELSSKSEALDAMQAEADRKDTELELARHKQQEQAKALEKAKADAVQLDALLRENATLKQDLTDLEKSDKEEGKKPDSKEPSNVKDSKPKTNPK